MAGVMLKPLPMRIYVQRRFKLILDGVGDGEG
jgi:hypothetical protein